jgi:hypothetical protein
MGFVYVVGRIIYRAAYLKDPKGRSAGFGLSILPTTIMLMWLLLDAVRALI